VTEDLGNSQLTLHNAKPVGSSYNLYDATTVATMTKLAQKSLGCRKNQNSNFCPWQNPTHSS
jgi:hypothetical protein